MNDVMDILKRARKCELEISVQEEHIERLRRIARTVKGNRTRCEKIVEKLASLEAETNKMIDKVVDIKREALVLVNDLTGEEKCVIERYYILGETWEQIANKMYMSERRVYLLRKSALIKLKQKGQAHET